ncbi:MAG TPA: glycine--tRNA ligase subunit beta [Stellaceae bacterium]|nr:glycine--tRNA ligase subunit beta [Stellaceae bacterium]
MDAPIGDHQRGELLLELLSEEIPARMQRRAIDDFAGLVRDKLAAAEIAPETIRGFVTPRRLTVIADGIPAQQPARREERRGPRVGAPQAALDGFLRAAGLSSIEACEIRDTGRGEFYFALIERPGRPAAEVLPELLRAAIGELSWPKSMRFPASTLHWVRPLASVICLYDGAVLPLALDAVPVGRTTRGHRFLSQGEITVADAADYLEKLAAAHVILDHDRRRETIAAELDRLAAAEGVRLKPDPALLDEVTGLVEYPVVLIGRIDDASMELPPEVLATAMRTHQKYFSCLREDGGAAPRFLFVANNLTPDDGRTVVAGNERVLRARLADARFFWDQDRKVRLEDRVEALKQRVYYDKLGTMYDKTERIEKLAAFLAEQLYPAVAPAQAGVQGNRSDPITLDSRFRGNDEGELGRLAQRAAHLAKADLSTGMVGEFPELQGVIGRYYVDDSENPGVADAIAEHYKPLGPSDTCPTAPISVTVALADKLDSLTAFFWIGEKPTGSRDPFALRRAAGGIIRLILENGRRLNLRDAFEAAELGFAAERTEDALSGDNARLPPAPAQMIPELLAFVADRLRVHLREQGARHDLVAAVFRLDEHDLVRLLARVDALAEFLASEDGANLLTAYRRAANIVGIEARTGGWTPGEVNLALRSEREEFHLTERLAQAETRLDAALPREDFVEAMAALATLRRPVDEFFDKVTVNTDDPALRENRLRLLSRIRAVMNQVADFSQIEG